MPNLHTEISPQTLPPSPLGRTGWPWDKVSAAPAEAMSAGQPWPKISIVTPTLNQGIYLEETIRSVLLQNYPNLEYIIIDGGSTDETLLILEKYQPWLTYWESKPDRGQSHAINKGLERSSGEIVNWLCSDDILLENALSSVAQSLGTNECSWVVGGAFRRDEKNGRIRAKQPPKDYTVNELFRWRSNSISQPSVFWNRAMHLRAGRVREDLHYCMDLDLWHRFFQISGPIIVPYYLSQYRHHESAKTTPYGALYKSVLREITRWHLGVVCESCGEKNREHVLDSLRILQDDSAAFHRIRNHTVLGRALRFWKRFINPDLPV